MSIALPALLNKLAPATRRALLITGGAALVGLALLVFAILPARTRLYAVRTELTNLGTALSNMRADIACTQQQQARTAAVAAECDTLIACGVIEPLLGSFAMRGKSLLDPIAQQTGFTINSVNSKDSPMIPLQVPSPAPAQLYGRQPVEFTGFGSYTQIVAFISLAEATLPLATLSSLTILSQPPTPEVHKAIITFEWPAKSEKRSAP